MQSETDAVVRSLGDMLIQLGCDSAWLIPNTALSSRTLNTAIASYQARLDELEIQVAQAIAAAQSQTALPPAQEEQPVDFDLSAVPEKFDNDLPIDLTSPDKTGGGFADEFDLTTGNFDKDFNFDTDGIGFDMVQDPF